MTTNDNTSFVGQNQPKAVKETPKNQESGSANWKTVTIGGATGVFLGAAAMYAADAFAGNNSEAATDATETVEGTDIHIAVVDQDLTFGEAFAAARAQVGAGGVFEWHGGIYGTYYATEWNQMSAAQQQQFTHQAMGMPHEDVAQHTTTHHDHVDTAHHDTHQQEHDQHQEHGGGQHDSNLHHTVNNGHSGNSGHDGHNGMPDTPGQDTEVRFLGVDQVETEGGQTMNVGHMEVDHEHVALVDVDNNMVFDVMVSDRNQNQQIDADEVVDISDQQISVTDFAVMAEAQNSGMQDDGAQTAMVNNEQDHIADDMPDYMNDVDVQPA